jgi:hypothetical protein
VSISVQDTAIELESRISQLLVYSELVEDPFQLSEALLFGVSLQDKVDMELLAVERDVYELLDARVNQLAASTFDAVIVVTTGWAAPLGDDGEVEGKPSEHPKKRRVRLCVVADKAEAVNIVRFADDPDEPIVDHDSATGSLANAIREFLD